MKRFILILCLAAFATFLSPAQTKSSERKAKLEKEIEFLDKRIKETDRKKSSAIATLTLTRKKVSSRRKLVDESTREIRRIEASITERQRSINRLQARLDTMSLYYGKLVKNAYKNRDARVWYMYLLSSDNIGQAAHRYSYLKNLSSTMNRQATKLLEVKDELQRERDTLMQVRAKARKLKEERTAELKKLQAEEQSIQESVKALNRNKAKYQKELAVKRKQVKALSEQVRKMVARKSPKPVDVKLSGKFAANKGKLPWPVEGVVVETFGEHFHPIFKSVRLPFNNGIGIATAVGAPVSAVFDGEVRQVIVMPGYNKCVLIQHGEYFTFYCKLSSVSVKAGDKVKTGQKIGKVDTISGETQLHFQIWKGRDPQNPDYWLR